MVFAVAVALVGSCGNRATQEASPVSMSPQAYESGSGVARDYRKAAAVYREQCADGCGDLAACRSLFDLAIDSRGIVPRVEHVATLTRMCKRGDSLGCSIASLLGVVDSSTAQPATNTGERCAAGDASACEVELSMAYDEGIGAPFEEPETEQELATKLEARMNNAASQLCRRGMVKACNEMVEHETFACRLESPPRNCIADVTADRRARGIDPAPLAYAWERVQQACHDGDADACALVPGHELSAKDLCNAGDYGSCAELATRGDTQAGKIACEAGVGTSCTPPRAGEGTVAAVIDAVKQLDIRCEADRDTEACRQLAALRSPPACAPSGRGRPGAP